MQLPIWSERYGTAHVLGMLVDVIAPPDSNAGPRALRERRILLEARRVTMQGAGPASNADAKKRAGLRV
jgi:hypothetical protein